MIVVCALSNTTPPRLQYVGLLLSTFIAARRTQSEKIPGPMLVTLSGILTLLKLMQPEHALAPIVVTLPGITRLARLWQAVKALPPILVTLAGIVISLR